MKIIDQPIMEINAADVGIHVTVEYIRRGDNPDRGQIKAIKLLCRWENRKEMRTVSPATQTEDDDNTIISAHKEEADLIYHEILAKELQNPPMTGLDEERQKLWRETKCWLEVANVLREKYPGRVQESNRTEKE
jgi:hypothetical protein